MTSSPVRVPRSRSRSRAGSGPALVLVLVSALLAARVVTTGDSTAGLPDELQDFLTLAISVVVESLPFVVLGILLSIVVEVWVPHGVLERVLPARPVPRRAVISLIGMLFPVCECGNVPLARGLMLRGFSPAEATTFLVAAPILNPLVIVSTAQAFGWSGWILPVRIIGGFVVANVVGWVVAAHRRPSELLVPAFEARCRVEAGGQARGSRWAESASHFGGETATMMPALFVGAAVAAAIQVAVPRSTLIAIGSDPVLSVLAMMLLAMTVSLCSNVDAFFALSFASTFLPGSITAFLLIGPIIDVKMIALLRTTFRTRFIGALAVICVLFAASVGLVMDVLV
ncbi:permease [Curtobacterium sp. MCBD17_040]|uniref:permease n=1 Tax=Curtobacterium sp. MCBD17_040 TaxID=2175674 RepID=UPI000DA86503|nr:permease [Curtobacterium sp. MCBD17_040]WIB63384.1 permease [Curtobacterium sp. MCBD17_040]